MKKVLCIGHAAYDITLLIDHFPVENSKVRTGEDVECGGGAAANAAYLLAKWGTNTSFVGAVGDDLYGKRVCEEFQRIGVNITYLEVTADFRTTTSYILANRSNGTRTIVVSRSKNRGAKTPKLETVFDVILVDGEELEISLDVLSKNKDAISVLDAGNLKENIVKLAYKVNYVVCSKDFAEEFTNMKINPLDENSLYPVYDKLKQEFKNNVIITLGEHGSFTKFADYKLIPSIRVKAIDSTGAGDIYHGAFTYFLANGYSLLDSMWYANVAGGLSVTKVGGKQSMPELSEVLNVEKNVS